MSEFDSIVNNLNDDVLTEYATELFEILLGRGMPDDVVCVFVKKYVQTYISRRNKHGDVIREFFTPNAFIDQILKQIG